MRLMKSNSVVAKTARFLPVILFALCLALCFASDADARGKTRKSSSNPRYAAVIMDAQTGKILHQAYAHKPLAPASLTKMMTLFMAFEAIENGKLHMNKYLTVSQNAINQPPSKLGLKHNTKITVREAIYILITRSANDVAYAMGETISGSHDAFARAMTKRAHELGMKNSYFYNASGLPHAKQKSTAYDMAVLGRALMQHFPQHYHFFKTIRYNYRGRVIETHNNLMRRFDGMDGMKTGYTHASGFNLVSSAVRNNRRVIVSVFGGRTAVSRDNHVADLMNRGFAALDRDQSTTQFASNKQKPAAQAVAVKKAPTPAPIRTAANNNQIRAAQPQAQNPQVQRWVPDGGQVRNLTTTTQPAMAQPAANAQGSAPTNNNSLYQQANYKPGTTTRNWGIQVGAFSSEALSQRALQTVQQQLRSILQQSGAQPMIVPLVTAQGTVYRARIIGLSPQAASQACEQLTDCMAFVQR